MPIKDGYETALEINEFFMEHPECECPIIACTANISKDKISKCFECGMDGYISKPIDKI